MTDSSSRGASAAHTGGGQTSAPEAAGFNGLPAQVWPRTARRTENGTVEIGGVALPELAREFGTPLFVVDEEDFRSRCRELAEAFDGGRNVHYASKAFLTVRIAQWVNEEGLSLDVASLGELQVALAAGFPPERITAHGNNKDQTFLESCVSNHVGLVVLDSFQELHNLNRVAGELGTVQRVLVRVTPGVDAHTHEFIATSHEDQKFGFSLAAGHAYQACEEAVAAEHLDLVGLHCHVGSQVFDADGFSLAAERILRLYEEILDTLPVTADHVNILDLGGGYGIAYTADQRPLNVAGVSADLRRRVADHARDRGVPLPDLRVEPGRAIAGPSTVTIYTVGTVKDVPIDEDKTRRYIAVDGGMSDNIRPMLYEAEYDVRLVNRLTDGTPIPTRLVGSHCESGDILIDDAQLPDDIQEGDYLALGATGAYCYAMSSRYNMMDRPAVVSVKDGQARLMVRRATVADYLRLQAD